MKGFIEIHKTNGIDGLKHKTLINIDQIEEVGLDSYNHTYIFQKNFDGIILICESYDEVIQRIEEDQSNILPFEKENTNDIKKLVELEVYLAKMHDHICPGANRDEVLCTMRTVNDLIDNLKNKRENEGD
jgi:hypothetical protein